MTGNRTTEHLMAMLEERGVKHELEHDLYVEWVDARGNDVTAFETSCKHKGDVLIVHVFLTPEQAVAATLGSEINGDTSDGYHTFNELYHHRAVLFSVVVRDHRELAWKARKHHDGTMYDGMFIVGIETPSGQATYHYDLDPYWDMFDCDEREFAPEWDGHTPDEAIARIAELEGGTCELEPLSALDVTLNMLDSIEWGACSECRCAVPMDAKFCNECGKAVKR